MKRMYTVAYSMFFGDTERHIDVLADCKENAYNIATYEAIPQKEGSHAYGVWVKSTTYRNGTVHEFNTFEGKRF